MQTHNRTATVDQYDHYVLGNYPKSPLTIVRGAGSWVWDDQDRNFLDFTSGIAVNTLGHCDEVLERQVHDQMQALIHASNLFRNPRQGELAEALVKRIGAGKVVFVNSGAEANEALLKLSRLFGQRKAGREGEIYEVITFESGFHGRTFGAMSATPQAKVQSGFAPLLPGFRTAKLNDLGSVETVTSEKTAAVFLETIQGEGGIHEASIDFLRELRAFCDEKDILLLIDEVQCGIARTGDLFAYQASGILPDAVGLAKGLGGGYPIGAMWVSERYADLFQPGSHGTTYGGGPVVCAAALAVLQAIDDRHLLGNVRARAQQLREGLLALVADFPQLATGVRGRGLLKALIVKVDPVSVVTAARDAGLLVPRAGTDAVRMLPPLTVTEGEITTALERLRAALETL